MSPPPVPIGLSSPRRLHPHPGTLAPPCVAAKRQVFHGTADVVTLPSLSIALFEASASVDKTLVLYENAHHAIYWESERVSLRSTRL